MGIGVFSDECVWQCCVSAWPCCSKSMRDAVDSSHEEGHSVEYHWGPVALRADVERGCWSCCPSHCCLSTGVGSVFWKELLLIAAVLILRGSVAWRVCCRPKAGVWSRVDRDSEHFSWCGRHHEPLNGTHVPLGSVRRGAQTAGCGWNDSHARRGPEPDWKAACRGLRVRCPVQRGVQQAKLGGFIVAST